MGEVNVKSNVAGAVPPKREPLPQGEYIALIAGNKDGATKEDSPRQKFTLEFQITKACQGEDPTKYAGKRVFQDFVIEEGPNPEYNAMDAYSIQQLLAATQIPHTPLDGGGYRFNTDHFKGKMVKITVVQKPVVNKDDPNGPPRIFNNVRRIDSAETIKEDDLV